jgi:hypothetical protein
MGLHRLALTLRCCIALLLAMIVTGCQVFGLASRVLPDPTVSASYHGLSNQTTAVMVWTDRATAIDWPRLQLDLTRGIQSRLQELASKTKDRPKDLDGAKFAAAESVVRYQHDHPETETEPITDIAPRLNVTRVIYIEIERFSTRPEDSVELFRGSLSGNLRVVEIKDGVGKIAFEEENIAVHYPTDSPDQGLPNQTDLEMYEKTLDAFSTQIMNRFVPHTEELAQ